MSYVLVNNFQPWTIRLSLSSFQLDKIAFIYTCIQYHKRVEREFEAIMFTINHNHNYNRKEGAVKPLLYCSSNCNRKYFLLLSLSRLSLSRFNFSVPSCRLFITLLQGKKWSSITDFLLFFRLLLLLYIFSVHLTRTSNSIFFFFCLKHELKTLHVTTFHRYRVQILLTSTLLTFHPGEPLHIA